LLIEAELHGIVAVALLRLHLDDAIWPDMHNRDGVNYALRVVNTRLAQLFSEKSERHN
jgi:hypothetical protein